MIDNNKISVIIRTMGNRNDMLGRALFSLYCNYYPDKEVVIVYQGGDTKTLEQIKSWQNIYDGMEYKFIQNTPPANEPDKDLRSDNINKGITAATGRYICFLDDDDTLAPTHFNGLIQAIDDNNTAWACGNVMMDIELDNYIYKKSTHFSYNKFSYVQLLIENFITIHSYVIDRNRINKDFELKFNTELELYEDYEFALRLAYNHTPYHLDKVVAFYKVRTDNTNSFEFDKAGDTAKNTKRDRAGQKLEQLKQQLFDGNILTKEMRQIITKKEVREVLNTKKLFRFKTRVGSKRRFKIELYKLLKPKKQVI